MKQNFVLSINLSVTKLLFQDGSPGNDEIETEHCVITPDEENNSPPDQPVYDVNKNVSNSNSHGSAEILTSPKQILGEKPFENSNVKTRKSSSTSSSREKRRKDKEIDAFPRPQRQFTLEEMIADMLPTDGELQETGDQRALSPEPRFQAWL